MNLRHYQIRMTNETHQSMKDGNRTVLIESPTGSGKTLLTANMLKSAANKGMPSLFICHRRELIRQSSTAFNELNIGHGIIGAGFPFSARPMVQICSIQTLKNKIKYIRKPKLVVFDECHHLAASTWTKVYDAFPDAYIIGLTATPQRLDGTGLIRYFPKMINGPTVQSLIDEGFLSKYKIYAPSTVDISKVHSRMGDFVTSELSAVIDKPTITGDAIKEYQRLAKGKRAIVRGVSIEHSKHIANQFNESGIKAVHLDSTTPLHIRDSAMDSFRRGDTLVLSNVDLFSEGLDVPAVECVVDLRPTKSLILWLQFIGRALRPYPGKEYAIIIDHAGNAQRHGLPCDIREWKLEGRPKKEKDMDGPKIKLCPACYGANQSWRKECQYCKHQFVIQSREVDQVEGELSEIDIAMFKRNRRKEEGMAESLEELKVIEKERGYKNGWAYNKFYNRKKNKVKDNW